MSGLHRCDPLPSPDNGTGVNGKALNGKVATGTFTNGKGSNGTLNVGQVPRLLIWSAADAGAVDRMVQAYQGYYSTHAVSDHHNLDKLAYTLATRRGIMPWRTFAVADHSDGASGPPQLTTAIPVRASSEPVSLGFIFTGQGAQYARMGLDLLRYTIFEASLRASDEIFASLGAEWTILGEIKCHWPIARPSV